MVNLSAQTRTINVEIEDHCYEKFTKQVALELYKFNATDTTYIASSTANPATFNGLDEDGNYMVKIKSDDRSKTELSLKDILLLREYILGVSKGSKAVKYSGDVSKEGNVSTLDIVLLSRSILGVPNINLDQWFFMPDYIFAEAPNVNYINKAYLYPGSNSTKFIAFNKGDISAAYFDCAPLCQLDSTMKNTVTFPSAELKKDQSFEFDLKFIRSNKNLGYSFSLVYKDLEIESIKEIPGTNVYEVKSEKTISFLNVLFSVSNNPVYEVAKIRVKALKNGNLASMLSLNPNFNAEGIYKTESCIASNPVFNLLNPEFDCAIIWPSDITIQDCNSASNTGEPIIAEDCKQYTVSTYTDQVFGNPCQKILRTWTTLNWIVNEVSSHIQTITIAPNYKTICLDAKVVINGSATIYAKDFIKTPSINSVFSFEIENYLPSKTLTYSEPYVEELTIYDTVSQEFCIAKVTKLECNNKANVFNLRSVFHNGFPVYTINAALFDAGNASACPNNITDFQISEINGANYSSTLTFPVQQYKGTTLSLKLRYKLAGTFVEHGQVQVKFIDQTLSAFNLTCYNDILEKNKPFEIAFFSPDFVNIYGIQGAIAFKDASILSVKKVSLSEILFNQQSSTLRFVWIQPQGTPYNLASTDTMFSITILPNKAGKVSDFLALDDNLLESEVTLNDLALTKINLAFNFLPRIVATKDINEKAEVEIYPNPNNGNVLHLSSSFKGSINVRLRNSNGQIFVNEIFDNPSLNHLELPATLPNGMYFVEIYNNNMNLTKKLIIAK